MEFNRKTEYQIHKFGFKDAKSYGKGPLLLKGEEIVIPSANLYFFLSDNSEFIKSFYYTK